jgi:hypothetical protein
MFIRKEVHHLIRPFDYDKLKIFNHLTLIVNQAGQTRGRVKASVSIRRLLIIIRRSSGRRMGSVRKRFKSKGVSAKDRTEKID